MSSTIWEKNSIQGIVKGFIDGTLPKTEWTHHAHLIICVHHLRTFEFYEATLMIKLGIIKYNDAIGLKNTIDRGYHETMTLFWIWVVDAFLEDHQERTIEEQINVLVDSPFSKKYLPFFFYSEDHIFSKEARTKWVEPDQRPLDKPSILSEYPSSIWYG